MLNTSVRAVARNLPQVRGAGRIYNILDKLYVDRSRDEFMNAMVHGFDMHLNTTEYVDRHLFLAPQLYDWEEIRFLRSLVAAGATVLDVGAHIGFYSLMFSRMVGEAGRVIAFEATPATYRRLLDHIGGNRANVTALNNGVSDAESWQQLWVSTSNNAGGNTLIRKPTTARGPIIHCRPLLDICRETGVNHIDLMKIDIEGMEFRALSAFFAHAEKPMHPRYIMTEYFPERVSDAGGDIRALLVENGYSVLKTRHSNIIFGRD